MHTYYLFDTKILIRSNSCMAVGNHMGLCIVAAIGQRCFCHKTVTPLDKEGNWFLEVRDARGAA